jgi:hypothetical protein
MDPEEHITIPPLCVNEQAGEADTQLDNNHSILPHTHASEEIIGTTKIWNNPALICINKEETETTIKESNSNPTQTNANGKEIEHTLVKVRKPSKC